MAYTRFRDDWRNKPDLSTPVTEAALEHFEDGIFDAAADADQALAALAAKADLVGGKVPSSQLPPLVVNETHTAASQAEMLALPALQGDVVIRTDLGQMFFLSALPASTLANWVLFSGGVSGVTSVAGKTGVVSLVKGDVGLGNVDNTADTAKPVSTAQQTALNLKANLVSPTFTGTPSVPTATPGTNSTQAASTAFVRAEVATAVVATGTGLTVYYNGATWPARPSTINPVCWVSTKHVAAAQPTMDVGDYWIRHPDAVTS